MSLNTDFSNMTLEELTPIVSMRPGKEYTREELHAARAAFLTMLGMESEMPASERECAAEITPQPRAEEDKTPREDDAGPAAENAPMPSVKRNMVKKESHALRFFYRLYAYFLVPLLAIEAFFFLLVGVAATVFVPDIPFLFLPVFCAVFYTMLVAIAWHQFLHRTPCGLLLNRSLMLASVLRCVFMLRTRGGFLPGVIFAAIFSLFFLFSVGYEHAFILPSPKKSRAR